MLKLQTRNKNQNIFVIDEFLYFSHTKLLFFGVQIFSQQNSKK